jgi:hypothetical protein
VIDTEDLDAEMIELIGLQSGLPWFTAAPFDAHRIAIVYADSPGEYAICCYRATRMPESTKLHVVPILEVRPARVTVSEAPQEQLLELQLDPDDSRQQGAPVPR